MAGKWIVKSANRVIFAEEITFIQGWTTPWGFQVEFLLSAFVGAVKVSLPYRGNPQLICHLSMNTEALQAFNAVKTYLQWQKFEVLSCAQCWHHHDCDVFHSDGLHKFQIYPDMIAPFKKLRRKHNRNKKCK